MLKDLFKQIKNRIINKEDDTNYDPSVYIPIKQKQKTYNLYDLPDGFVIEGDVSITALGLTELPDLSKVTVKGDFNCSGNYLTSLKGAPQQVGGSFWCDCNHLTSLQGAPQKINGGFYCQENKLASLEGAPQHVGGYFVCGKNKLTTLDGAPQKVGGNFECDNNELTALKGAPQVVGKDFICTGNNIGSLGGAPKSVGRNFICRNNPSLTSLIGLPPLGKESKVFCDEDVGRDYGFKNTASFGIEYEKLLKSPDYKIDLSTQKILQKNHHERLQKEAAISAKRKSGFEAFKKQKSEERE